MTYFLFILAVFIWPFGQLLNFRISGLATTIYPLDLVCLLLSFSVLFSKKSRKTISGDPLFKPLVYFLLAAGASIIFNFSSAIFGGITFSLFYLLRLFIYPSIYFSAKLFSRKQIFKPLRLSLFVFSLIGLTQYLFFPDMRFLKYLGFDDHYYRLIGSFYDPNFSGAIFAGFSLFFLALGQWLPGLALVPLLALTFSRASYLVFLVGIFGLLYFRKKWSLLIFLLLFALTVYFTPKPFGEGVNLLRTFSIYSRFDSWQIGFNLFMQKPVLGWGYNTLRSITGERFQIDNSFLYLAATTGLAGLLAFFNLLKRAFFQTVFLPSKIFLVTILLHSLFNNSLFYIWIYFAFWLVLGLPTKGYKES